jgi:leader peptidase (prepilin peptidase)/N-methyltransferase
LIDLTGILVLPGVLVGWQALIGVVLLATVIAATLRHWANLKPWLAQGRDGLAWFAIAIPAALTIQIVIWRLIEEVLPLPSTRLSPGGILLFGLAILIVPVLLREPRYLMPSDYGDTAPPTTPSSAEQD